MSWESWSEEKPCQCGKGKYIEEFSINDFLQTKTNYKMLCDECKAKYYYNHDIIGGHPGTFREKGWILK